eukprot:2884115-Prymnesium_polylepis.1
MARSTVLLIAALHGYTADAFAGGAACTSSNDCSSNGLCHAGSCKCDAHFTGATCSKFAFEPLDPKKLGQGLKTLDADGMQVSSWGGS